MKGIILASGIGSRIFLKAVPNAVRYSVQDGYGSDAGTFESLLWAGVMVEKERGCEGFT